MKDMNHLSVVDGAFLHLESPEMPMHVGSLVIVEPPPEQGAWYDAVKAHVASRMHLPPVFTRKLALMPFDLANPDIKVVKFNGGLFIGDQGKLF